MLDKLDQIDWSRLSHAYGPATDIPSLIRALATDADESLEEVHTELVSSIAHQGSVYDATPVAVPFLLELLEAPATREKDQILDLLQCIAEGARGSIDYWARKATDLPFAAESMPFYIAAAYAVVEQGFDLYCRLLVHEDAGVRISSAFLLGQLTGRRADVAQVLLQAIDSERDDRCRAAFLLSLSVLIEDASNDNPVSQSAERQFQDVLEESTSAAPLAAGIALLRMKRTEAIPRVLERAWPRLLAHHEFFSRLPWIGQNDPYTMIAENLAFAPDNVRLDWILRGLKHPDPEIQKSALYAGGDLCSENGCAPSQLAADFVRLANSPDAGVRRSAIRSLVHFGTVGADCLKPLRRHPMKDVREEATAALQHMASDRRSRQTRHEPRSIVFPPWVSTLLKSIWRGPGSKK
jgi:HEAT repeat protein